MRTASQRFKTEKGAVRSVRASSMRIQKKDDAYINNCKEHLKINGDFLFFGSYKMESKKTLILTPTHFFQTVKNFKPSQKDSFIFPWNYLTNITIDSKRELHLTFKSQRKAEDPSKSSKQDTEKLEFHIAFLKDQFDEGMSKLCDIIQNVLTPQELDAINFSQLNAAPVQRTTLSAYYRFKMLNSTAKLHEDTAQKLEDMIIFSQPAVNLSNFSHDVNSLLPVLFDLLPLCSSVQILKLPIIKDTNIYELASNLIANCPNLRAIKLSGKCESNVDKLITAINNRQNSNFSGISFNLAEIEREDLQLITDAISNGKIRSVEFSNAINSAALNDFYNNFFQPKITDNLMSLSLAGMHDVDLKKVFPKLRKVALLSLANCGLNVANVFQLLCQHSSTLEQLQLIDLSGNEFTSEDPISFPDESMKLPPNLKNFIMNEITWENYLKDFLEFLFTHVESQLNLSISKAMLTEQNATSVFDFLDETDYTGLSVLIWDETRSHANLFNFLQKNPNFVKLQINSAIDDEDEEIIDALCDFIKNSESLESLIIKGGDNKHLRFSSQKVLEACKSANKLKLLDIANTRVGSFEESSLEINEVNQRFTQCINTLKEFAKSSSSLQYINFDGMMPNEDTQYTKTLMELVSLNGNTLHVSYPSEDLRRLVNCGALSKKDERKITKIFYYTPVYPDREEQPDSDAIPDIAPCFDSPFRCSFNIFKLYDETEFPLFVNLRKHMAVSKAQPLSFSLLNALNGSIVDDHNKEQAWDAPLLMQQGVLPDFHSDPGENEQQFMDISMAKKKQRFKSTMMPANTMEMLQKQFGQNEEKSTEIPAPSQRKNEYDPNPIDTPTEENLSSSSLPNNETKDRNVDIKPKEGNEQKSDEEQKKSDEQKQKKSDAEEQSKSDNEEQSKSDDEKPKKSDNKKHKMSDDEEQSKSGDEELNSDKKSDVEEQIEKKSDDEELNSDKKSDDEQISDKLSDNEEKESRNNDEPEHKTKNIKHEDDKPVRDPSGRGSLPRKGLPPIPLKRTASNINLIEPNYDLPLEFSIDFTPKWEDIDQQLSLDKLYDKIFSETRSNHARKNKE